MVHCKLTHNRRGRREGMFEAKVWPKCLSEWVDEKKVSESVNLKGKHLVCQRRERMRGEEKREEGCNDLTGRRECVCVCGL